MQSCPEIQNHSHSMCWKLCKDTQLPWGHVDTDLLEGKTQDGDLLAGDGVEHARDDAIHEAVLLVVVHLDHAVPVVRHTLQAHALAAQGRCIVSLLDDLPSLCRRLHT
jgi:hypothetical protein